MGVFGGESAQAGFRVGAVVRAAFVLLAMVSGVSYCAQAQNAPQVQAPRAQPGSPGAQFDEALADYRNRSWDSARTKFQAIVDGGLLNGLDARQRHQTLNLLAYLAMNVKDRRQAHDYAVQSTSATDAIGDDWLARLAVADTFRDPDDAIVALTMLVRKWPATLFVVDARYIYRYASFSGDTPQRREAHYALLRALFETRWKPKYVGEPSVLWVELIRLHLERGDRNAAAAVLERVDAPDALINMRADRRFDALREVNPRRLDVAAAIEAEIKFAREQVARAPNSLEPITILAVRLLQARRYAEALEVLDAALKRAASLTAESKPFTDTGEFFVWVLDYRARALIGVGRFDDAVRQRVEASSLQELGAQNVSQAINLGWTYVELHRPVEALEALRRVGTPSGHGRVEIEGVKVLAAVQTHDQRGLQESLDYLRAHRNDGMETFQWALLDAGAMDEAADLMVERLNDVGLRAGALWALQDLAPGPDTPLAVERRARLQQLRSTARVVAALERVGRTERYPLTALE